MGAAFGSEEAYSFPLGDLILSFVSSVSFIPAGLHINLPGKYSWKMSFSKWIPVIRHQPVVYSSIAKCEAPDVSAPLAHTL